MFSDVKRGTPMMELVSLEKERCQNSGPTESCGVQRDVWTTYMLVRLASVGPDCQQLSLGLSASTLSDECVECVAASAVLGRYSQMLLTKPTQPTGNSDGLLILRVCSILTQLSPMSPISAYYSDRKTEAGRI